MLSSLKSIAFALLLSTIVHGACVDAPKDSNDVTDPVNFEVQEPGSDNIAATTKGIDISASQPTVNWVGVVRSGVAFVYIQATVGTTYVNPYFQTQWNGATAAVLFRGAYHIARPNLSSGAIQANFFLTHGGVWTKDGRTLPGAVEFVDLPDDRGCYGLSHLEMIKWIADFSATYRAKVGRFPVIYTSSGWWTRCTNGDRLFSPTNPLWIIHWGSSVGTLPGWGNWAFWQYANVGPVPGEQDYFNGDVAALHSFAL